MAPTVLALLDVPVSREIEGKVLSQVFATEIAVNFVNEYQMPEVDPSAYEEIELDQAEIERLKALGYIN